MPTPCRHRCTPCRDGVKRRSRAIPNLSRRYYPTVGGLCALRPTPTPTPTLPPTPTPHQVDDMGFGLGLRSKRFVVVAEAGIVKHVLVDEGSESLQARSLEVCSRG